MAQFSEWLKGDVKTEEKSEVPTMPEGFRAELKLKVQKTSAHNLLVSEQFTSLKDLKE